MQPETTRIGIVGGTGALGGAIARALVGRGRLAPSRLWLSNRSGSVAGLDDLPGVRVTASTAELAAACDAILLCVPPAQAATTGLDAPGRLVLSVMAGIGAAEIARLAGTQRVIRAMSSPAARDGLAFSPYFAAVGATPADRRLAAWLFGACGLAEAVADEAQIDLFTALTGPVPGFVACFAEAMVAYAVARGIAPGTALRAVRQLFLASGTAIAASAETPADHVREMIDYGGTTAAGLLRLRALRFDAVLAEGLDAAVAAARALSSSAR